MTRLGRMLVLPLIVALVGCTSGAPPASKQGEPTAAANPTGDTAKPVGDTAKPAGAAGQSAGSWSPTKPLKFIVQYAAGGGVDVNARIVSKYAERYLGQPIVVENVVGAAGATGTAQAARAAPDGHTLLFMVTPLVIDGFLKKDLPYKVDSFRPVAQVTYEPNVLAVQKGGAFDKKPDELLAQIKQSPGRVKMGIGGVWTGSDFARAILEDVAGVQFQRVPFDGGGPALTALLAGDVDAAFPYWSEASAQVAGEKLTAVAVADEKRIPQASHVPTFRELSFELVNGVWRILGVPAGTPNDVVAALHDAFKKALDDPEAQRDLANANIPIVYRNSTDSAEFVAAEVARHGAIVAKLDLKPQ